jgi:hypothetical protein
VSSSSESCSYEAEATGEEATKTAKTAATEVAATVAPVTGGTAPEAAAGAASARTAAAGAPETGGTAAGAAAARGAAAGAATAVGAAAAKEQQVKLWRAGNYTILHLLILLINILNYPIFIIEPVFYIHITFYLSIIKSKDSEIYRFIKVETWTWKYRTISIDHRKKYRAPTIEYYRFLLDWQKHSADAVKINNAIVSLACVNLCKIMSGSPEMFFLLWTCYLCWHT